MKPCMCTGQGEIHHSDVRKILALLVFMRTFMLHATQIYKAKKFIFRAKRNLKRIVKFANPNLQIFCT